MAVTEGFKDFVKDLLADFGPVTIRNMFGGAGIYADGVMFAILVDDTLYLKADEVSRRAFETEGMGPFTYEPAGKGPIAMAVGGQIPLIANVVTLAETLGWAYERYLDRRSCWVTINSPISPG